MNDKLFLEQCKRACRFMNEAVEDDELPLPAEDAGAEDLPTDVPADDEGAEGDEEPEMVPCPDCGGTGVITDEDGNEVECPTCGGTGEVAIDEAEFDFDPEEGVCPVCGAHLNVVEPEEDSLAGEDDLEGDDLEGDDLSDLDLDDEA